MNVTAFSVLLIEFIL